MQLALTHVSALATGGLMALASSPAAGQQTAPSQFTRLEQLRAPRIVASAQAAPGTRYNVRNLVDNRVRTEYSSNDTGTNTFVEFDFGTPTPIGAFRHVDRNDPATVASSELSFLDKAGSVVATLPVKHVNRPGGVTVFVLPSAVTAQRVRWRVTDLNPQHPAVGGGEIIFFKTAAPESLPNAATIESAQAPPLLERSGAALVQPVNLTVRYPYVEPAPGVVRVTGSEPKPVTFNFGDQTIEIPLPPVQVEKTLTVQVEVAGQKFASREVTLKPVRKWQVFILPHSHVDIGYTALQTEVVTQQNANIEAGLRLAEATANYPEGARFKWNTESLWVVENYLRVATPEQRANLIAAVKARQLGLDAFYCNMLTGLCRPEELLQLMRYATELSQQCGVPVDAAMISDVPGYTWSIVSAMAQAGVKYFSFAPNHLSRIGSTLKEWENRPFWWQGPDGRQRILSWCPTEGYSLGHSLGPGQALTRFIPGYLTDLESSSYPYEITHVRWSVGGDNGPPDAKLADVVRDWNARYASPCLVIATTAECFHAFEQRYGDKLPVFSGDYTPYWEDGAGSSAYETALNRASAERLTQAEALWAIRQPGPFPAAAFQEAWRNVLLYSEHTWGSHNSISAPDLPDVRDQWNVKRGFALDADKQSRQLLDRSRAGVPPASETASPSLAVFNTSSWERTDLVTLTSEQSTAGDRVVDDQGQSVPSQRLSSGGLVFLARNVPVLAAKQFRVQAGPALSRGSAKADGATLSSPEFNAQIDEQSGAIKSLFSRALKRELVDAKAATALNEYFYLPRADLKGLQRSGTPRISVKEKGPLVASLLIESDAPGCKRLLREVRLVDGLDRVDLINTVDKLKVRTKESVHFGYGFNVPDGVVRMDVGWAVVRPEVDQIPASCKNWFSVQRWVDISNDKFGVTWSPVDAPLVEVGGITANLIDSKANDWRTWVQHLAPSQTLYSWVMNNHWYTNYRADQEGPVVFRYSIRAHKAFAPEEAAKFGVACSQPLVAGPASGPVLAKPRLELSPPGVLASTFKPSDDGKGWIVRLFGASGKTQSVKLAWAAPAPQQIWLSDTSERPKQKIGGTIEVPAWGIVTLRAD
jgi:alpha-mannosidase